MMWKHFEENISPSRISITFLTLKMKNYAEMKILGFPEKI